MTITTPTLSILLRTFLMLVFALLPACGGIGPDSTEPEELLPEELLECAGNRVIRDEQVLSELSGCTTIVGDLAIYNVVSLKPLSKLKTIKGNLTIGFHWATGIFDDQKTETGVSDLSGLHNLTQITGSLHIANNPQLLTLAGLENLAYLGANLTIGCGDFCLDFFGETGNPLLRNIDALQGISQIEGDLRVADSPSLENLNGFVNVRKVTGSVLIGTSAARPSMENLRALSLTQLETVGGEFMLRGATLLQSLEDLENLKQVGGLLTVETQSYLSDLNGLSGLGEVGGLEISGNDNLDNLQGLDNLKWIQERGLKIAYNKNLSSLTGLETLAQVKGELVILYNERLSALTGLQNLSSMEGSLVLEGNKILTNLDALGFVQQIQGDLSIQNNPEISELSALGNLEQVSGRVRIVHQNALRNLNGLASLRSIGGLYIAYNDSLWSIEALSDVVDMGGAVHLDANQNLRSLKGLHNLESIGHLLLSNSAVVSLDELRNLKKISGTLYLKDNNELLSIAGLNNIQAVSTLFIHNNPQLKNLDGLQALTTVKDDVTIGQNSALWNLAGLSGLRTVGGDLEVYENPLISDEQVQQLTAQLVPIPPDLVQGAALYDEYCVFCHGPADHPMTLGQPADFSGLQQRDLREFIETSHLGKLPDPALCSEDCARDIADYIFSVSN